MLSFSQKVYTLVEALPHYQLTLMAKVEPSTKDT